MNARGFDLSDLEDINFFHENPQLEIDAVFKPGIDTPFLPTAFDNLGMVGSSEHPMVLDEGEDQEKNLPTSPLSEWPTGSPRSLKPRLLGRRFENVPKSVYKTLFD